MSNNITETILTPLTHLTRSLILKSRETQVEKRQWRHERELETGVWSLLRGDAGKALLPKVMAEYLNEMRP